MSRFSARMTTTAAPAATPEVTQAELDAVSDRTREVFETAQGTWTADAPSGRTVRDPSTCITFYGVSDPTDVTNGIDTPANIVTGDQWVELTDYV